MLDFTPETTAEKTGQRDMREYLHIFMPRLVTRSGQNHDKSIIFPNHAL